MIRNRLYYGIKPVIPLLVRSRVRRWFALRKRAEVGGIWPIMPGSEAPPRGWPGWPGGKQFALVLTHDVEGSAGVAKCEQVMELEMKMGFRSAFNLIPEGEYSVSAGFREKLKRSGFELGVHDLYHDGKLFLTKKGFSRRAVHINRYLKDWGAVGFRSGFMLHNLNWLHELNIEYDDSTFDIDPFEPQPQGHHTIFPFWVGSPDSNPGPADLGNGCGGHSSANGSQRIPKGYVELPYTLPQDSTLFLLLAERHPDIWFQKLDWVAKHGGMVLLDTHPDYMAMPGDPEGSRKYPVEFYSRFLEYIHSRYSGAYWHALPHEVAGAVRQPLARNSPSPSAPAIELTSHRNGKPKIWIDLDNTPHVPFFEPILDELRARGFPLVVTARDAFQVCDLADKKGIQYQKIGRHHGKNRLLKAGGLIYRAAQLAPLVMREKPALSVSHGSRSQILLSNSLGIPSVLIEDYEYSQFPPMMRPSWVMAPTVIPDSALGCKDGHIVKYPGIKEDVYAWRLHPNPEALLQLGLSETDLVVTVRPPATEAHYHNPEGEKLFEAFMHRACETPSVRVVLLPRNKKQVDSIRGQWPAWFKDERTVIPKAAIDGLDLIWHSDLVVSGGGTMNREAAALGVPVYSIFRGTIGAVDRQLAAQGRLVLVESIQDVHQKIKLVRRTRKTVAEITSKDTLLTIVDAIQKIIEKTES